MTETIGVVINEGTNLLKSVSDTPQLDCYLLVGEVLGRPREWLIAHSDESVCTAQRSRIRELLDRRCAGEPVAYIKGKQPFWRRDFKVTQDTLIPRPETELLIELALDRFDTAPRKVVDLGTGTGAIAVSLAAERPDWQILATDINEGALKIARENAGTLGNISFCLSSWFSDIEGQFDLIVSNPPYIRKTDPHLEALMFEPIGALTGGHDGLDCIRQIAGNSREHLVPGGQILLEHGYDQQEAVKKLLASAGFTDIEGFTDLQGQPRAVIARSNHLE